ncbi:MAG: hypothetical protein JKX85_16460 [Phycisphaeraceae bacterium]|nr:hypothetical protein [Phycisphaeraceae bacterium]
MMVDILGLASNSLSASDFTFAVGNDSNPASWSAALAPTSVTVRAGAGVNSSDRVTMIWSDQTITHQWLQVTVKANANTGIAENDVFYFGNAVGETGNSATDVNVNIFDISGAWSNLHGNTGDITDRFDTNKDGSVNIFDISGMWSNLKGGSAALQLITVPNSLSAPPPNAAANTVATPIQQLALAWSSSQKTQNLQPSSTWVNNLSTAENRVKLLLVEQ